MFSFAVAYSVFRFIILLMLFYLAVGLYVINLGVGAAAQFTHRHFGKWHHPLYFIVFLAAIGATVRYFHPALLLTLAMLAIMPKTKPGTWRHPAAALLGFIGYLVVMMN